MRCVEPNIFPTFRVVGLSDGQSAAKISGNLPLGVSITVQTLTSDLIGAQLTYPTKPTSFVAFVPTQPIPSSGHQDLRRVFNIL